MHVNKTVISMIRLIAEREVWGTVCSNSRRLSKSESALMGFLWDDVHLWLLNPGY